MSWFLLLLLPILAFGVIGKNVDILSMPGCAKISCLPFHASSIGCTRFTQECFCNALAPVNCARSNCTGNEWYALEDWYSTQCPGEPPLVMMDPGIPLGARKCIRDWIVPQQCRASITRNCFCRLDNVTATMNECISNYTGAASKQAKDLSDKFYRDTCVLKEGADGEQRPGSTPNEEIITPPETLAQSSPDDQTAGKISLIAGLTSSFITIAGVAWWFFIGCCCGVRFRILQLVAQRILNIIASWTLNATQQGNRRATAAILFESIDSWCGEGHRADYVVWPEMTRSGVTNAIR
jgi:hypothetical protein